MPRRLHPLNALRAFEASARHLSFVEAADELGVTPAAISHQVKKLEDYLRLPLFRRLPNGLALAEAGEVLRAELGAVFLRLDRSVERVLDARTRGSLTISVAPMFAVKWLLPRLQRFNARCPEIDIRMSSSLELVDFQRDAVDAAIRLGQGRYPGLAAELLFDEVITPMCSPRLLDHRPALASPDDLRDFVLLHDDSVTFRPDAPTWRTWLSAAGAQGVDAARGPRFQQPEHALQAAIDGTGIALGWYHLAAADLAVGRLVTPFELQLPLGAAFYLVYPEAHSDMPKLNAFHDWLFEELSARDRTSD